MWLQRRSGYVVAMCKVARFPAHTVGHYLCQAECLVQHMGLGLAGCAVSPPYPRVLAAAGWAMDVSTLGPEADVCAT
jgi:hypothetical protein